MLCYRSQTLARIEARTWIKTSGLDLAPWQVECTDTKHALDFTERSIGMAHMGIEPTCRSDLEYGTMLRAEGQPPSLEILRVESAAAKRAL